MESEVCSCKPNLLFAIQIQTFISLLFSLVFLHLSSSLEINTKWKWKKFVWWFHVLMIRAKLNMLYTYKSPFTHSHSCSFISHMISLTDWSSKWYWQCGLGLKPATFHYQYNHLSHHLSQTLNPRQGLILVGLLLSRVCEVLWCIRALSYCSCALLPYTVSGEPPGTQNLISPHLWVTDAVESSVAFCATVWPLLTMKL